MTVLIPGALLVFTSTDEVKEVYAVNCGFSLKNGGEVLMDDVLVRVGEELILTHPVYYDRIYKVIDFKPDQTFGYRATLWPTEQNE